VRAGSYMFGRPMTDRSLYAFRGYRLVGSVSMVPSLGVALSAVGWQFALFIAAIVCLAIARFEVP
jgi:hypothetical protein